MGLKIEKLEVVPRKCLTWFKKSSLNSGRWSEIKTPHFVWNKVWLYFIS